MVENKLTTIKIFAGMTLNDPFIIVQYALYNPLTVDKSHNHKHLFSTSIGLYVRNCQPCLKVAAITIIVVDHVHDY